jgi:riboflavin kinase/FMN adenylyltransferase
MKVFIGLENLPKFNNAVISIGTFDGVHIAHQHILNIIKDEASMVNGETVCITFHPHPKHVILSNQSNLLLLTSLEEKLELLKQNGIDNTVVIPFTNDFAQLSATEYIDNFLIKNFQPYTIAIGYNHHFGKDRKGNVAFLKQVSLEKKFNVIEINEQLENQLSVSSTLIRQFLSDGNIVEAKKLLGYSYGITGSVIKGNQRGRTIGFPTANVFVEERHKLIPKVGVYMVHVTYNNVVYPAMMNIGYRPTFGINQLSLEAHIFQFDKDIYNQEIKISFISFIREEMKFESIDALKIQLENDKFYCLTANIN